MIELSGNKFRSFVDGIPLNFIVPVAPHSVSFQYPLAPSRTMFQYNYLMVENPLYDVILIVETITDTLYREINKGAAQMDRVSGKQKTGSLPVSITAVKHPVKRCRGVVARLKPPLTDERSPGTVTV